MWCEHLHQLRHQPQRGRGQGHEDQDLYAQACGLPRQLAQVVVLDRLVDDADRDDQGDHQPHPVVVDRQGLKKRTVGGGENDE